MKNGITIIEFDVDPNTFPREAFRSITKEHISRPLTQRHRAYASNLAMIVGEITKNFYDHAYGQGRIELSVSNESIHLIAYDCGPGYRGKAQTSHIAEIAAHHEQYGSSKGNVLNLNAGLGLVHIISCLEGLRKSCGAEYKIETIGRFYYEVTIPMQKSA